MTATRREAISAILFKGYWIDNNAGIATGYFCAEMAKPGKSRIPRNDVVWVRRCREDAEGKR